MPMLSREELIEQAYFFRILSERTRQQMPSQEVISSIKEEVLSTTKLPMALDFISSELRLSGVFAPAMRRLDHYFTPFQTFIVSEAENDRGRFELNTGLEILRREAEFRGGQPTPQALFLYQFESISRNRLNYDHGLQAVADDPIFDEAWHDWILTVRRQIGLVDIADLIYVRSEFYVLQKARQQQPVNRDELPPVLFGEKEGRIALVNRRKDPLLLFSALSRQLGYPEIPRPKPEDNSGEVLMQLVRRVERMEQRIKLLEEEQKGGIDIQKFYQTPEGGFNPPKEP
ncbi:MAG: hypothetical protein VX257_01160 [Planctomycetota bacterium]|nr:hypothetical protein [Planctomycetota bacterium]